MDEASEVSDLVSEPLFNQDLDEEISALFGDEMPMQATSPLTSSIDAAAFPKVPTQTPTHAPSAEERALSEALKNL